MIEAIDLSKSFEDIKALNHINAHIEEGKVFGLIGTNGAGKSTFLRLLAGIYKPDEGSISIDGVSVWEHPEVKAKFFYISDNQYFLANATPKTMIRYYSGLYKNFDTGRCLHMLDVFRLGTTRRISSMSKGMKKQVSLILAICSGTEYILCDETFDGLDPVMREAVKKIWKAEMEKRNFTPIVASHNLRELQDICDHVGLLHMGGLIMDTDFDNSEALEKLFIEKTEEVGYDISSLIQ